MDSLNTSQFSSGISKERIKIGRRLYIAAWGVEILAVTIGLAIAMAAMAVSFTEMNSIKTGGVGFSGYLNIFIAALPFLMVAGVELTKIPFVGVIYKTTASSWKVLFGFALLFLSLITFESALNGFERNFNAITFSIDKYKKDLIHLEEKIPLVESSRDKSAALTSELIESSYDLRRKTIAESRERESVDVQNRIGTLRATIKGDYVESKKEERVAVKLDILSLLSERDSEIKRVRGQLRGRYDGAEADVSRNRRAVQADMNDIKRDISSLNKKEERELSESFFGKDDIRATFRENRSELKKALSQLKLDYDNIRLSDMKFDIDNALDAQVEAIRDKYSKRVSSLRSKQNLLDREISKILATREKDIELSIKQHLKDLNEIEKKFIGQREENESERSRKFDILENNEAIVSEMDSRLELLGAERADVRNVINRKVGDNQVFRMAQWWFDKESAADLGRSEVMVIAALWFGSLALLVAFTGPILAFGSYVIQDERIKDDKVPSNYSSMLSKVVAKAIHSIRLFYIEKRKTLRIPITKEVPVEVIKEIAVNKIVQVEVPVEVIKKEIVHVPLYTNDINLLNIDPLIPGDELESNDDVYDEAENKI